MKIATRNLLSPALDWAVAKSLGIDPDKRVHFHWGTDLVRYSHDWREAGRVIEQQCIFLSTDLDGNGQRYWWAEKFEGGVVAGKLIARTYGPTPLIAAMRCQVASIIGDEVDVPDAVLQLP